MALDEPATPTGAAPGGFCRLIRSTRFFVITLAVAVLLIAATVVVALVRFGPLGVGA